MYISHELALCFVVSAALCAYAADANAKPITFLNSANQTVSASINNKCIVRDIAPHTNQVVSEEVLASACKFHTADCSAKYFTSNDCSTSNQVASYVFDVKSGLTSAQSDNPGYQASIYDSINAAVIENAYAR